MDFAFTILTNDSGLLGPAVVPFRAALLRERGAPRGWGVAQLQGGQFLVRKQPQRQNGPFDFCDVLKPMRTTFLLGHVRNPDDQTAQLTENTQPFRYGSWIFCDVGAATDSTTLRARLGNDLPPFLRHSIRGTTLGETLFYVFLNALNRLQRLEDVETAPDKVSTALGETFALLDRISDELQEQTRDRCLLVSNGRMIFARQRRVPLVVVRQNTYLNVEQAANDRPLSYPHLKALAIFAGTAASVPGAESVPENVTLAVNKDLNMSLMP